MAKPKRELPLDTTIRLDKQFKDFLIADKISRSETIQDVLKRKIKNSEVDL